MQLNRKLLIIAIFMATYSHNLFACICDYREVQTFEDIAEFQFIAHVKIHEIRLTSKYYQYEADISILELFTGDSISSLFFDGGHYRLSRNDTTWTTSCDIAVLPEEEWVIFGYKINDIIITNLCAGNKLYKDSLGVRDWFYGSTSKKIETLREIFEIAPPIRKDGINIEYFPSGQKELVEFYEDHKLHGERKIWHPNGVLRSSQFYIWDKLNGDYLWYDEMGRIHHKAKYKDGKLYDTAFTWYSRDTTNINIPFYMEKLDISADSVLHYILSDRIKYIQIFDEQNRLFVSKTFKFNYLYEKYVYDYDSHVVFNFRYFKNGNLFVEQQLNISTFRTIRYKQWDVNGNLTHDKNNE